MKASKPPVIAVILCGGPGSRLWPLSRSQRTKPFLEMPSGGTLFAELINSLHDTKVDEMVIVAGSAQLEHCQSAIASAEKKLPHARYIIEPEVRGTAPALVSAMCLIESVHGQDAVFMMYPADHHVVDRARLQEAVDQATKLAAAGKVVVLGIEPHQASTEFGYIRAGASEGGYLPVASFVEKPDSKRAQELIDAGGCYWNAGMFCASVATMRAEMETYAPEVARVAAQLKPASDGVWEITPESYQDFPVIMVDHAVAEKTQLGVVVPVSCGWSDLGGWNDWIGLVEKDEDGNRRIGTGVVLEDARNVGVLSHTGRTVAVAGCENMQIVDLPDALLVTGSGAAGALRKIHARLQEQDARNVSSPSVENRAWGSYRQLGIDENWQVKRIEVLPGQRLSLQAHEHRCENWIVVSGVIDVTIDEKELRLKANESCFIPQGAKHRMGNSGSGLAVVIEVQSGDYLGEDDIVRYEDDFGRA